MKRDLENLEVTYFYRDGGNNKRCQSVVIGNSDGLTPDEVAEAIRKRFSDLQGWADILHFQPETFGWPSAYFPGHDLNGDDLNVHELDRIVPTDKPVTDAGLDQSGTARSA